MTINSGKLKKLRIWLPAVRAGSGADVFTLRLAEALERAGHETILQWFDHRYELMPWHLKRVSAPSGIDLVHAGSWQGFAFKRKGIPLVITEHQYVANPDFARYRNFPQALYHKICCERWARLSYAAADAIVAVSEFCAASMRRDIGQPVSVIHNWVDIKAFAPDKNLVQSTSVKSAFRLLFAGNPSRWKGADLLPSLASLLGGEFEIACLGGLRKAFNSQMIPPNMTLLPSVAPEFMPAVYHSADGALVPARYEAFGYVALEAMACGLPVIGFNTSGTAEVCVANETALLAPIEDVEQLASHAKLLASDAKLRLRLGAAGRKRAVDLFSERRAIASYVALYRKVVAKYA